MEKKNYGNKLLKAKIGQKNKSRISERNDSIIKNNLSWTEQYEVMINSVQYSIYLQTFAAS